MIVEFIIKVKKAIRDQLGVKPAWVVPIIYGSKVVDEEPMFELPNGHYAVVVDGKRVSFVVKDNAFYFQ